MVWGLSLSQKTSRRKADHSCLNASHINSGCTQPSQLGGFLSSLREAEGAGQDVVRAPEGKFRNWLLRSRARRTNGHFQ